MGSVLIDIMIFNVANPKFPVSTSLSNMLNYTVSGSLNPKKFITTQTSAFHDTFSYGNYSAEVS
jgi:hypothetical protein